MSKKVCFLAGEYPPQPGGVGEYTSILGDYLAKSGWSFFAITSCAVAKDGRDNVFPEVPRWNGRCFGPVLSRLKEIKPNIVNIQFPGTDYRRYFGVNFLAWFVKIRFPKTKIISTLHEFSSLTFRGRFKLLISCLVSKNIIFVDPAEKNCFDRYFPLLKRRTVYIHLASNVPVRPITQEQQQAVRVQTGFGPEDFIIGYFGFVNPGKGFEHLLEALAELRQDDPRVKLLVIGALFDERAHGDAFQEKNIAYRDKIKSIIQRHSLQDAVKTTGRLTKLEQASPYFQICDLCVYPFDEGLSARRASLLAALDHGRPVISTYKDGVTPKIFRQLKLVPPQNSQALIKAIREIRNNPHELERLIKAGRAIAPQFSWPRLARETDRVFRM